MKHIEQHITANKQQGNILLTSLLVMVVINLLGVGLAQISSRHSGETAIKTVDSMVYNVTESCSHNIMTWFKGLTAAPTALPYVVTENDLSSMYSGAETTYMLNKLAGYSFTCSTDFIVTKNVETSEESGAGGEVGVSSGYGVSGALSSYYYYEIDSSGSGPRGAVKTTKTLVSVKF